MNTEKGFGWKESFGSYLANGLAISNDNIKIIKAALTGEVDTLLVNKNHEHLWGKYDPENHKINHLSDMVADYKETVHPILPPTLSDIIKHRMWKCMLNCRY